MWTNLLLEVHVVFLPVRGKENGHPQGPVQQLALTWFCWLHQKLCMKAKALHRAASAHPASVAAPEIPLYSIAGASMSVLNLMC